MLNKETFILGNIKAEPGERCSGFLELAEGRFKLPVTILNGEKPGQSRSCPTDLIYNIRF